ncbi:MAG: hypothetical protein QW112_01870, partial [Candidatus Micrarchaeia archaeon]
MSKSEMHVPSKMHVADGRIWLLHSALSLFLVLTLLTAFVSTAYAAECGGAVACNCGDNVTSNYNLSASLTGCAGDGLVVGADGIALDCKGYNIIGSGSGYGINLTGRSGVMLMNCIISNFSSALSPLPSVNNALLNMTARKQIGSLGGTMT